MASNSIQISIVRTLLAWFGCAARDLPWRRTRDPYGIWVAEIMLQQTQVKTVVPYWERWMRALPTVGRLANAPPEQVLKLWEGLGYYTRARNLQQAARIVVAEHDGQLPVTVAALMTLPGIGRYTAGAIASIAFRQPAPVLDGNVVRVLSRLFGLRGDPRERKTNATLWALASQLVQRAERGQRAGENRCGALNQSLMELGAVTCTPKSPACPRCPVRRYCYACHNHCVDQLPRRRPRAPIQVRDWAAFVVEHRGRFLVRQRPHQGVNAGLWEFPNAELDAPTSAKPTPRHATGGRVAKRAGFQSAEASPPPSSRGEAQPHGLQTLAQRTLGFRISPLVFAGLVRHTVMQQRIRLSIWRADVLTRRPTGQGCWGRLGDLRKLPFAGAHRKVLNSLKLHTSKLKTQRSLKLQTSKPRHDRAPVAR